MTAPALALADDTLIYAVGDIHGRADLLKALHHRILDHARRRAERQTSIAAPPIQPPDACARPREGWLPGDPTDRGPCCPVPKIAELI